MFAEDGKAKKGKKGKKGKGKKGRKTTSLEEDDFVKEDEEYDSDQMREVRKDCIHRFILGHAHVHVYLHFLNFIPCIALELDAELY